MRCAVLLALARHVRNEPPVLDATGRQAFPVFALGESRAAPVLRPAPDAGQQLHFDPQRSVEGQMLQWNTWGSAPEDGDVQLSRHTERLLALMGSFGHVVSAVAGNVHTPVAMFYRLYMIASHLSKVADPEHTALADLGVATDGAPAVCEAPSAEGHFGPLRDAKLLLSAALRRLADAGAHRLAPEAQRRAAEDWLRGVALDQDWATRHGAAVARCLLSLLVDSDVGVDRSLDPLATDPEDVAAFESARLVARTWTWAGFTDIAGGHGCCEWNVANSGAGGRSGRCERATPAFLVQKQEWRRCPPGATFKRDRVCGATPLGPMCGTPAEGGPVLRLVEQRARDLDPRWAVAIEVGGVGRRVLRADQPAAAGPHALRQLAGALVEALAPQVHRLGLEDQVTVWQVFVAPGRTAEAGADEALAIARRMVSAGQGLPPFVKRVSVEVPAPAGPAIEEWALPKAWPIVNLPYGWERRVDTSNALGRFYYADTSTETRTFHDPRMGPIEVGKKYEATDQKGGWVPVRVVAQHSPNSFAVRVVEGPAAGDTWQVHALELRLKHPLEAVDLVQWHAEQELAARLRDPRSEPHRKGVAELRERLEGR